MARKVFFSFHYTNDIWRVSQVRNSWLLRKDSETQPFYDKADWEKIKKSSDKAIENWIEQQLKGCSVTVVLIGSETASREWVLHEIKRSYELGKGIIGVYIHNLKDQSSKTSNKGKNPFDYWSITKNGKKVSFSTLYPTYDYILDDGKANLGEWIEEAAKEAGK